VAFWCWRTSFQAEKAACRHYCPNWPCEHMYRSIYPSAALIGPIIQLLRSITTTYPLNTDAVLPTVVKYGFLIFFIKRLFLSRAGLTSVRMIAWKGADTWLFEQMLHIQPKETRPRISAGGRWNVTDHHYMRRRRNGRPSWPCPRQLATKPAPKPDPMWGSGTGMSYVYRL